MESLEDQTKALTVDTSKPFDFSSWHEGNNIPCNDLYFIKEKTSHKFVEVHKAEARGKPPYAVETLWKTGLPTSDLDQGSLLVHGSVLYYFRTRNTGGLVQCSRLSEDYRESDLIVSIPGLACDDDRTYRDRNYRNINVSEGKLAISDGDIYFIHLRNTGSGMVELHRWRYKSNYQNADLHATTPFETKMVEEDRWDVWAGRLVYISKSKDHDGRRLCIEGTATKDGLNDYSKLAPGVEMDFPAQFRDGHFYVTPNFDVMLVKWFNTSKFVEVHIVNKSKRSIHMRTGLENDSIDLGKIYLDKASFNPRVVGDAALSRWMAFVGDKTELTTMTIPGTHDSHATMEHCPEYAVDWAVTQEYGISDQLKNGIRYLDLRVGEGFRMRKGVAEMEGSFHDCSNEIHSFLSDHPTETVLVRVKWNQSNPSEPSSMEREVARIWKDKDWYAGTEWPTLGDVRGRAILLRCFKGILGIDVTGFHKEEEKPPPGAWYVHDDRLNGGNEHIVKEDAIFHHLEEIGNMPEKQRRRSHHFMVFTNLAERNGGPTTPRVYADKINPMLMRYVKNTSPQPVHLGIIIMDFIEPEHASKIISWNFNPHLRSRW